MGAKWALLVLHNLMDGTKRFGELQRRIPQASPKMLSQRLRELEDLGLVRRTVLPVVPPHVEYSLTQSGRTLRRIIDELAQWGRRLERAGRTSPAVRQKRMSMIGRESG